MLCIEFWEGNIVCLSVEVNYIGVLVDRKCPGIKIWNYQDMGGKI